MKLVVTGSRSFIGRALRRVCREREIGWLGVDSAAGADDETIEADIRDPGLADRLPTGADAIVHLAAISRDQDCRRDPVGAVEVNVVGTLNVIEAARRAGIPQIIFTSSEWVYPDAVGVVDESTPIDVNRLTSEYSLTKLAGERLLAMAVSQGGLSATVLRLGIVWGPRPSGAAPVSAIESLWNAVKATGRAEVGGALGTARRFVHVDDVAAGILAAAGRQGFAVFNLTGDELITLGEVVRVCSAVCGRPVTVVEGDPGRISIRNAANGKARGELGWQPRISLHEGLAELDAQAAGDAREGSNR
jgi:UDP-glucose 4-epimerase